MECRQGRRARPALGSEQLWAGRIQWHDRDKNKNAQERAVVARSAALGAGHGPRDHGLFAKDQTRPRLRWICFGNLAFDDDVRTDAREDGDVLEYSRRRFIGQGFAMQCARCRAQCLTGISCEEQVGAGDVADAEHPHRRCRHRRIAACEESQDSQAKNPCDRPDDQRYPQRYPRHEQIDRPDQKKPDRKKNDREDLRMRAVHSHVNGCLQDLEKSQGPQDTGHKKGHIF